MLYLYKVLDGGGIEPLLTTDEGTPFVAARDDLGITNENELAKLFFIEDDRGEQFLSPSLIYPGGFRNSHSSVYLIDRDTPRFVFVSPNQGAVWIQVNWSPTNALEKDLLGFHMSVSLTDVQTFTPTPAEVLTAVLIITTHLEPAHYTADLYERGFNQALKSVRTNLQEAAYALRPYTDSICPSPLH